MTSTTRWIVFAALLPIGVGSSGQSQLPPCPPTGQKQNCFGQSHYSATGTTYVGEYRDGMFHGQGKVTYRNSDSYIGEFKQDAPHGYGTFLRFDGSKHVGEFVRGQVNGRGTEYGADGSVLRSGLWEHSVFVGPESQKAVAASSVQTAPTVEDQKVVAEVIDAKKVIQAAPEVPPQAVQRQMPISPSQSASPISPTQRIGFPAFPIVK